MTGLSRNDSAGDIETLEYCYSKLQDTMCEDKKQRLQHMIAMLKSRELRVAKEGKKKRSNYSVSYIPPAL